MTISTNTSPIYFHTGSDVDGDWSVLPSNLRRLLDRLLPWNHSLDAGTYFVNEIWEIRRKCLKNCVPVENVQFNQNFQPKMFEKNIKRFSLFFTFSSPPLLPLLHPLHLSISSYLLALLLYLFLSFTSSSPPLLFLFLFSLSSTFSSSPLLPFLLIFSTSSCPSPLPLLHFLFYSTSLSPPPLPLALLHIFLSSSSSSLPPLPLLHLFFSSTPSLSSSFPLLLPFSSSPPLLTPSPPPADLLRGLSAGLHQ